MTCENAAAQGPSVHGACQGTDAESPVMAVAIEGAPVRGHTLVPAKVHTCTATCWCHGAGRHAARIGRELRSRTVPPASESLN
jgi:hypothetical protein